MRRAMLWTTPVLWTALAACGADPQSTSPKDAANQTDTVLDTAADSLADMAVDTYVEPKQAGYTLAFRKTLANKAPQEFEVGEQAFFEDTWGQEKHSTLPPADFLVALWQADKAKWGIQFSNYGLVPDPGDDLPVGLKRGTVDASRVKDTCALCHTTQLPDGKLWAGMPATSLQWGKFQHDVDVAWEAAGNPPKLTAQERKLLLATPPGGLVVDDDGQDIFVLNDFPLYAGLHKMSHFNRLGSGNDLKTEVYLSLFGATSAADFPPVAVADAVVAYFTVLDEPPAPTPIDASAVTQGRAVFESQQCNTCHYDDLSKNPPIPLAPLPERRPGEDPKFPQGSIATDGVFVDAAVNGVGGSGGPGPGLVDLLIFISDNGLDVSQPVGYVAANLHGLWASAPYLHNGAVATLEDLLTPPDQRPKTFTRHGFVYDTAKVSHSAAGHGFGTDLQPADKADLIAYLRSL